MPPSTSETPKKYSIPVYAVIMLLLVCAGLAFYGGTYYQWAMSKESSMATTTPQTFSTISQVAITPSSVHPTYDNFCNRNPKLSFLPDSLAFICDASLLKDFSWSLASSSASQLVAFGIYKKDGTMITSCCGNDPLLALQGRIFVGTLAEAPEYTYRGLYSYLDDLKIGLAQSGYIMAPFTLEVPDKELIFSPISGEGLHDNQGWNFIKIQNDALYVMDVEYISPVNRKNLSMKIFIADPVKLDALPVVPR